MNCHINCHISQYLICHLYNFAPRLKFKHLTSIMIILSFTFLLFLGVFRALLSVCLQPQHPCRHNRQRLHTTAPITTATSIWCTPRNISHTRNIQCQRSSDKYKAQGTTWQSGEFAPTLPPFPPGKGASSLLLIHGSIRHSIAFLLLIMPIHSPSSGITRTEFGVYPSFPFSFWLLFICVPWPRVTGA